MTTLTDLFTDVADAIRTKKGSSEQIPAENFPNEILSISGGGNVGTIVKVNNVVKSEINFEDDPQSQITANANNISIVSNDLNSETISRENSDNELQSKITSLNNNLSQEISNRQTQYDSLNQNKANISLLSSYSLKVDAGKTLEMNVDPLTFILSISLKNESGDILSTQAIDLPLETMVVGASYSDGNLILTLKNGETLSINISSIVSGLVPDSRTINNKSLKNNITLTANDVGALPNNTFIPTQLSDLDSDSTHRTVTDNEKNSWNDEIENRQTADTNLQSQINTLKTNKLDTSTASSTYATKTELNNKINTTTANNTFATKTALSTETTNRQNADTNLQTKITSIENKITLPLDTVSEILYEGTAAGTFSISDISKYRYLLGVIRDESKEWSSNIIPVSIILDYLSFVTSGENFNLNVNNNADFGNKYCIFSIMSSTSVKIAVYNMVHVYLYGIY